MEFSIGFHAGEEKQKNLVNLSHGLELTPLIVVDIEAVFVSWGCWYYTHNGLKRNKKLGEINFSQKKLVKSNTHIFITMHPKKKIPSKWLEFQFHEFLWRTYTQKKAHFLTHCVKFSLTCWSTWGPARFWNRGIRPSMEAITQPAHSLPSSSLPYVGAYK